MRNPVLILSLAFSLSGCASLYSGYSVAPLNDTAVKSGSGLMAALTTSGVITDAELKACTGASPVASCATQRNQIVSLLVLSSEDLCMEHRRSIYGKEATFNITAGTFTNLFAGWAALAPGERGKSILAALALFSSSERSLVNETIYKSIVVQAVDKKILVIREEKARAIAGHFQDTMATYPMFSALRDVMDLHNSCSFMNGLVRALDEGTQETSRQKVARLNEDLKMLKVQIDASGAKDNNPVRDALVKRYEALSAEIIKLEHQ